MKEKALGFLLLVAALGLGGCNELVQTFDPPTVLKATANPASEPIQVGQAGEYPAGRVFLRLENPKMDSLNVLVELVSPPAGVRLAPSSQAVTVTKTGSTTLEVKLVVDPDQALGNADTRTLNLTLRLTPEDTAVAPVSLPFTVALARSGGSGGGGGGGTGTPSISLALNLDRLAGFPGDTLNGQAVVTASGGASGLTVVEVAIAGCALPASAVRYTGPNYGNLTAGGTFTVPFAIAIPEGAEAGGCVVEGAATTGSLTARASARFDVLALPQIALSLGTPAPVLQGEIAAKVPLTLTPKGGWTGVVELNVLDVTNGTAVLTSATEPTYLLLVGNQAYFPDSAGRLFVTVSATLEGYLALVEPNGWQAGDYRFLVRATGPNTVQEGVAFTVLGGQ